jgi:hypothetical protein
MDNIVDLDPALRRAEELVQAERFRDALVALRLVCVPAVPDTSYVERVLACDAAAREGLAA